MNTTRYAEGTAVPMSKSRIEIEQTLHRFGATGFLYGYKEDRAVIAFELKERRYRMEIHYPELKSFRWTKNRYQQRTDGQMQAAYEQEQRRLWRSLLLLIKAKLEAVTSGIASVEEELLPYTVMPNGQTVGEWLEPQLEEVYHSGMMPPLLPGANGRKQIGSGMIEGEVVS